MINHKNYDEVSRVLGQSETDKQLEFLGKALCEALPQLKNDPTFTSAAESWSRRQNTWPTELIKELMDRCPPIHNQASIAALNNAYAVYVHQINEGISSLGPTPHLELTERNLHLSQAHNSGILLGKSNITAQIKSYRINEEHKQSMTVFCKLEIII